MKKWIKKVATTGGSLAAVGVVLVIAVAVNIIVGGMNLRVDLTEDKLYSLSDGTRKVLGGLENPVVMKVFFNRSNQEVPVQLKDYMRRVEDLLREYAMAAGGKLTIEDFDPKPDSDAEEWAQRYGLSGQQLGMMGPTLFMGVVAVQGDAEAVLPMLDPRAEDRLEYDLTRLITRVAQPAKPVVGVLSPLRLLGAPASPYPMPGPAPAAGWFALTDLRKDYQVREVAPDAEAIDADVDALIVVHPKALPARTLYAIDQFVLRGGHLLAFMDPMSLADMESQSAPNMGFQRPDTSSTLDVLLKTWGVTYDPGQVAVDLEGMSRLRGAENRIEESPVWLSLRSAHVNRDDVLTAQIESLMLPYAGVLKVTPPDGVSAVRLIETSTTASTADAMTAQFGGDAIRRGFKSGMERLPLAVRLHGRFKTAFPDGQPKAADAAKDGEAAEKPAGPEPAPAGLREAKTDSVVVLVADVDMLADRFCVQEVNFLGFRGYQPINDNLALFANMVDQIAGSTALVAVRARGRTERPFEVVQNLQRKAQEQYMQEEMALQAKLETAQQRLNELSRKESGQQRLILSGAQQEEVRRFRAEVTRTREQLKQVRRRLREDIERLGMKLKLVNILLMPILVAGFGIGFGVYRKQRTRS